MTENLDDRAPVKNEENSAGQKILKFAVIFMGLLIILGLAVIVGTVIKRTVGKASKEAPSASASQSQMPAIRGDIDIILPNGATVLSESLSGSRLMLRVEIGGTQKLLIFDLGDGKLLSTVTLKSN